MVRWGRHSTVATGSDSADQVSVSQWNADLSTTGIFGFTKQAATISSNAIVPTGTVIEIAATGTLSTITPTSNSEFDLIYLLAASGATVTLTHDATGAAGKVRLLAAANKTLSETSPTILICRTIGANKEWIEYGGGITNTLDDVGDVTITSNSSGEILKWNGSAWINNTLAEANIQPIVTNVSDTEIGYLDGVTSAIQTQIDTKAPLASPTFTGTVNGANLILSGDLTVSGTTTTINSTAINVNNQVIFEGATADNYETTLTTVDPTADRTVSLPNATDTLVGKATTDTLTNKTISLTSNTLTATSLELKTAISDETGSGALVFGTSPTLTTPVISGDATTASGNLTLNSATNKVEIKGNGSTVTGILLLNCESNSHGQSIVPQPHAAGVTNTLTLPAGANQELVGTAATQTLTNKTLTTPTITGTPITAPSVTTTALDFGSDQLQTISISANTTFTTTGLASGKSKTIKITTDATLRTLTFPAWIFVGTKPTSQAASKIGILTLTSFGTTDANCVAAYAVET